MRRTFCCNQEVCFINRVGDHDPISRCPIRESHPNVILAQYLGSNRLWHAPAAWLELSHLHTNLSSRIYESSHNSNKADLLYMSSSNMYFILVLSRKLKVLLDLIQANYHLKIDSESDSFSEHAPDYSIWYTII